VNTNTNTDTKLKAEIRRFLDLNPGSDEMDIAVHLKMRLQPTCRLIGELAAEGKIAPGRFSEYSPPMPGYEMAFQVPLWAAIALWSKGNMETRIRAVSEVNRLIHKRLGDEKTAGIKLAASVAADYDRTNSHPYRVSDCILGKLNVIPGKPRRNKGVVKTKNRAKGRT
jgi:hypothetical protein